MRKMLDSEWTIPWWLTNEYRRLSTNSFGYALGLLTHEPCFPKL